MASQYPAVPPNASARIPIPSSAQTSSLTPSQTLLDRTSRFIEKNRNLLLIGATVAVSAGAGYYLYNRTSGSSDDDKAGGSSSPDGVGASKNKKKKKGKKSKFLKGDGFDGPLLEEIIPENNAAKPSVPPTTGEAAGVTGQKSQSTVDDTFADVPDAAALASMSEADRNALGASLKDRGNKFYKKGDFKKAVECYTRAIEVSVKRDPVFFSNRAACYSNYSPPEWEKVVEDCDEALKLDKTYGKALKRRAGAYERLGKDEEAVRDFTASVVIGEFNDQEAGESVERCVKRLAATKAKEQLESRQAKLPSPTFIASYLAAFRPHPKPELPSDPSQGDQTLSLAFDALSAADYAHALSFVNEAIDQSISSTQGQAEAYNLRGTFKFLMGDALGAKADLEKSLDLVPDFIQSLVKIASVHVELGDHPNAFGDFETAIRYNPNDPDVYYHRGQVYFIMEDYERAIADYVKSTELDGTFVFSQIQHAVALYKQGNKASCMAAFRRILKQFPDRWEPCNYYGEILIDQGKFQEAIERFDRSIELDMNNRPRNILTLVNKATALFAWKSDFAGAERLSKEALDVDPSCDLAVALLAQLSLQQGKNDEAIKWFGKSAELSRTEVEMTTAITYEYATKAQQEFLKNYPEYAERLNQAAPGQA